MNTDKGTLCQFVELYAITKNIDFYIIFCCYPLARYVNVILMLVFSGIYGTGHVEGTKKKGKGGHERNTFENTEIPPGLFLPPRNPKMVVFKIMAALLNYNIVNKILIKLKLNHVM